MRYTQACTHTNNGILSFLKEGKKEIPVLYNDRMNLEGTMLRETSLTEKDKYLKYLTVLLKCRILKKKKVKLIETESRMMLLELGVRENRERLVKRQQLSVIR